MALPPPCKFFANGYCRRGESCRFAHEKTTITPAISRSTKLPSQAEQRKLTQDPRSQIPCFHHARGHCRNGSNCPYSHIAEKGRKTEADLEPEDRQNFDSFTREFGGALAQFDIGAQVSKISLLTDFSAARIDGMPMNSTPESIASLLSEEGIQLRPECVRIWRQDGTPHTSADIKVDDPTFAKRMCNKLRDNRKLKARYPNMEVFQVSASLPPGTNNHRIECKKVQCSWFKPSKTAWLNFGNDDIAKRVCDKFNSKSYKVLGQTQKCNAPRRGGGGRRNPLAWTLILTALPARTTEKDIMSAITSRHDKPRNIELGTPSYSVEEEVASATVMSLLFQAGPIEWSQVSTELEGKRAKAVARYCEESDARTAANSLHDKPLPFCESMTLTVQLVSTAKFKVASSIFNAVQSRIRTASQVWDIQHLKFKIYPSAGLRQQYRVLKIEGEVFKDVATARETLNEILDGVTVMSNGKPVWTPSLIGNGTVFQNLKQIQKDHGVMIIRNKRKQELKLFCSTEKCADVESIINYMINAESYTTHIIELKSKDFRWACSGGFKMIAATLGENIATFDIVSTPKRILIGGSVKEYNTALRMMNKRASKEMSDSVAANEDCAVCWGPAENPVFTKCNHVYCIECFELSCNAASSNGKDFSIKCHGDMGQCQAIFSLEELQESLSSKAFEDILETSFSSHIQRNPQALRYCPKPNCHTVYRVTDKMHFNTCVECCTVICTFCHHPHENQTCAEYEYENSGKYEETLRLMKKMGIKSCPKCNISIEKTEGCNHIACTCGAHLCWVCLEVFPESELCYDHMNAEHGGIGLAHLDRFQW